MMFNSIHKNWTPLHIIYDPSIGVYTALKNSEACNVQYALSSLFNMFEIPIHFSVLSVKGTLPR